MYTEEVRIQRALSYDADHLQDLTTIDQVRPGTILLCVASKNSLYTVGKLYAVLAVSASPEGLVYIHDNHFGSKHGWSKSGLLDPNHHTRFVEVVQ